MTVGQGEKEPLQNKCPSFHSGKFEKMSTNSQICYTSDIGIGIGYMVSPYVIPGNAEIALVWLIF